MTEDLPCLRKMPLGDLAEYPLNPRTVTPEALAQLDRQLSSLGNLQPLTFNVRTGNVISGNQRLKIYQQRGDEYADVWCVDLPEDKERLAVIALNNHAGDFDAANLKIITEAIAAGEDGVAALALTGFREGELESILASTQGSQGGVNTKQEAHKTLASRFIIPPFSVLDARQGYWQERKAAWIALGLRGEVGRGANLLKMSDTVLEPDAAKRAAKLGQQNTGPNSAWKGRTASGVMQSAKAATAQSIDTEGNIGGEWTGTSIFDPVLTEAMYHWFCTPNGSVFDPFSGGVTRGAVAGCTGHPYTGIELSPVQISANEQQWPQIKSPATASTTDGDGEPPKPNWIMGDSRDVKKLTKGEKFDMIFSCPPYAFLERYSDDPRDLSTLPYDQFLTAYRAIIMDSIAQLKPNRFAVFVVGEVREPKTGNYINFVPDTVRAFEDTGAHFYNEIILVTAVGTLPIRVGRAFETGRKVGKALRNGTLILTPTGWAPIESLKVGEQVFSQDGIATKVTGVFPQGIRSLWKITFNDGISIEADSDHLWAIQQRGAGNRVLTTAQIIREFGLNPQDPRPSIPLCRPIRLPSKPVPLNPYLVGLLLGDGGLAENTPKFTNVDSSIIGKLADILPAGMEIKARGITYGLVGEGSRSAKNPLTLALRQLGMMGLRSYEESVPKDYLWNDWSARLAVLRGLMDADGTVTLGGRTSFSSTSVQLRDDVAFLARSLGANVTEVGRAKISGFTHKGEKRFGRPSYGVRITGGPCPFLLERKAKRWCAQDDNRSRTILRRIKAIERVQDGNATCISVAHPSGLFVAENFIVTHNTHQNVLVFFKGDPQQIRHEYPAGIVPDLTAAGDALARANGLPIIEGALAETDPLVEYV